MDGIARNYFRRNWGTQRSLHTSPIRGLMHVAASAASLRLKLQYISWKKSYNITLSYFLASFPIFSWLLLSCSLFLLPPSASVTTVSFAILCSFFMRLHPRRTAVLQRKWWEFFPFFLFFIPIKFPDDFFLLLFRWVVSILLHNFYVDEILWPLKNKNRIFCVQSTSFFVFLFRHCKSLTHVLCTQKSA